MYDEQQENQGNNLLGGVVLGAGLLAGGLGARSLLKNRIRKANVSVDPPNPTGSTTNNQARRSGQGGTQVVDLPRLPGQGGTSYQSPRKSRYESSDAALKKFTQDIEGGSLGVDYQPTSGPVVGENVGKTWQMNRDYYKAQQEGLDLITDPRTGEIYRRGGSQSINQMISAPKNQGGGINLSKQNLMGQGSLTTDQMMSFGRRQTSPDVDYVRGRIAKSLEAPVGNIGAGVELRQLPPVNRVNQLISEIGVDEMGRMTAGPEYAKEAGQFAATESSRQSAAVRRMEKQDPEFERLAKEILAEQRGTKAPKLSGYSEGPIDSADKSAINAAKQNRPETLVEVRDSSRPIMRTARNEAVQTANDQSDMKFQKNLQRNEDVDLTIVNEDILDKQKARAFDQLMSDAKRYTKDKQIASEIDLNFDYSSEEARQAADVGAALERIRNNPKRVAAEGIISELQAAGKADRDLDLIKKERNELPGLKVIDNTGQRELFKKGSAITGENIKEVLTGETAVIDKNMRNRALRGGTINEEGNYFVDPGTITYVGNAGAENVDFRDASTGLLTSTPYVASGPKTPEGAASILASEAIRKQYQNQRPEPLKGASADVGRAMGTLREGMSVEPSEIPPSTQVPTVNRGGYEDGELVLTVAPETQFTGDAIDAAGPVLFTGKNKRDSQVVGTSPPLVQGLIRSNPKAAAENEAASQSFLQNAIRGGLTQKQTPAIEVYETPRLVGPAELAGSGSVPLSRSAASLPRVALVDTGYAIPGSDPVGTPSTGAMTVGINYAEMPKSEVYRPTDIGRVGGDLTSRSRFIAAVPTPPSVMPPLTVSPGLSKIGSQTRSPSGQLTQYGQNISYPRMRGDALFPTGTLINDPEKRGGPVKFKGRERRENEYVRPISERLGRGDTMQRFPIIRRG